MSNIARDGALKRFFIDAEIAAGLKNIKEREGIPEGEQIRRAVREWLIKRGGMKAGRKRAVTRRRP
jgi:hypothetical protein